MSNETAFLALMLDGPLQSWGHASRFQRRTTALHPTRSGIVGMLCAALGVEKGSDAEQDWLARLDPERVRVTVFAIPRRPKGADHELQIRRMEDFHTVEGTRSAENKIKSDAVLTYRQYLLDARFGVLIEGSRAMLRELHAALRDPRWGVWLGRKCCIPAAPIPRGIANSETEALGFLDLTGAGFERFASVSEAASFAEGTDTLMDAPVNFKSRQFKPRRIAVNPGTTPTESP